MTTLRFLRFFAVRVKRTLNGRKHSYKMESPSEMACRIPKWIDTAAHLLLISLCCFILLSSVPNFTFYFSTTATVEQIQNIKKMRVTIKFKILDTLVEKSTEIPTYRRRKKDLLCNRDCFDGIFFNRNPAKLSVFNCIILCWTRTDS